MGFVPISKTDRNSLGSCSWHGKGRKAVPSVLRRILNWTELKEVKKKSLCWHNRKDTYNPHVQRYLKWRIDFMILLQSWLLQPKEKGRTCQQVFFQGCKCLVKLWGYIVSILSFMLLLKEDKRLGSLSIQFDKIFENQTCWACFPGNTTLKCSGA